MKYYFHLFWVAINISLGVISAIVVYITKSL